MYRPYRTKIYLHHMPELGNSGCFISSFQDLGIFCYLPGYDNPGIDISSLQGLLNELKKIYFSEIMNESFIFSGSKSAAHAGTSSSSLP